MVYMYMYVHRYAAAFSIIGASLSEPHIDGTFTSGYLRYTHVIVHCICMEVVHMYIVRIHLSVYYHGLFRHYDAYTCTRPYKCTLRVHNISLSIRSMRSLPRLHRDTYRAASLLRPLLRPTSRKKRGGGVTTRTCAFASQLSLPPTNLCTEINEALLCGRR